MSNAIVTVIMTALMLAGVSVLAQGSFSAVGSVSDSWKQMEVRSGTLSRTDVDIVETSYVSPQLEVTLRNVGGEALRDFAKWDALMQYYETDGTYHTTYVPYAAGAAGPNEWQVVGLYADASEGTGEVYQPDIFDPSEELVLRLVTDPPADTAANNLVVIGTPNGVTVSAPF